MLALGAYHKAAGLLSALVLACSLAALACMLLLIEAANAPTSLSLQQLALLGLACVAAEMAFRLYRDLQLPKKASKGFMKHMATELSLWKQRRARHWPDMHTRLLQHLPLLQGNIATAWESILLIILSCVVALWAHPLLAVMVLCCTFILLLLPEAPRPATFIAPETRAEDEYSKALTDMLQQRLLHAYHDAHTAQQQEASAQQHTAAYVHQHLRSVATQGCIWAVLCVGVWLVWQGALSATMLFMLSLLLWRSFAAAAKARLSIKQLWSDTSEDVPEMANDATLLAERSAHTAPKQPSLSIENIPLVLGDVQYAAPFSVSMQAGEVWGIKADHPQFSQWLLALIAGQVTCAEGSVQLYNSTYDTHTPPGLWLLDTHEALIHSMKRSMPMGIYLHDYHTLSPEHLALLKECMATHHRSHIHLLICTHPAIETLCSHMLHMQAEGGVTQHIQHITTKEKNQ